MRPCHPFRNTPLTRLCVALIALGSHMLYAGMDDSSVLKSTPSISTSAKSSDPKNLTSLAAAQPPPLSDSPIKFRMGVPVWASGISGNVGVKGVTGHVDVPFSTLFDHLDAIAPLSLDGRYGKWGVHIDGQYVKLSEHFEAKGILFKSGEIEMEQAFANFNVSYRVVENSPFTVDAYAGGRYSYFGLHGTLASARPLLINNQDESGNTSWVDPIFGVNAKVQVLKPWALVFTGDVGGFGVGSRLTYQLFGGAEVQIARHFYARTGYRYIYTDYESNGNSYKIDMSGPQIEFGVDF